MTRLPWLVITVACAIVPAAFGASALVTTEWVARNLNNEQIRVVEVSVDPGVYERGHVPGAVNLRWHTDLVDPVRRDVVSRENFEKLMSQNGVTPETPVIVYGDHNNWFAAWGAWVFNQYGHNDVRLMDGGRSRWEAEKRPLSTAPPSVRKTNYKITTERPELRARLPDVLEVVEGRADGVILDIRSPDEYNGVIIAPPGVQELAVRAGHVPGAVNVPWSRAVDPESGMFKSREELEALYRAAGVDGSKPVITYCRIGERSSHTWFALKHILRYDVRNYDGSWTEYGNAVGVPIVNPAGTVWTGK